MEEDDNNNIVQDDQTNQLIQDLFNDVNDDIICDEPMLKKVQTPLFEGSSENILFGTLLLINLKALNGLSNTCMPHILRYNVICFIA